MDQSGDGLLVISAGPTGLPGPTILHVNQGLLVMTGWAMEDVIGQPLQVLVPASDLEDFLRRLPVVGQTRKRYHVTVPLRLANGGTVAQRWLLRAGSRDEDGNTLRYVIGIRRTESPAHPGPTSESALRSARMEALAQVATGVAHDFNNVLAAVLTSVTLAMDEHDDATRCGLLEDARASCDAARTLVRRLLSYARGVGGGRREILDPVQATREAIRLASFGANVRCDLKESGPGQVQTDPVQLLQVLSNLLINARQAMPDGGTVEIEVGRQSIPHGGSVDLPPGDYVEWVVRDRGCGIPPEGLTRIFDAFYTTKKEGSGIGLSTSLAIAREHGGTITVTSKPGYGSEFRVLLPEAAQPEIHQSSTPSPLAEFEEEVPGPGCGHVVVADDHDAVRESMKRQLTAHGYTVHTAISGLEAVRLYRQTLADGTRPLAVFMDLTFPGGMTGEEAAREILEVDASAFIVACSGFITGMDEETTAGPFAASLPKPHRTDELCRVLGRASRRLRMASPFALV